jgi:multidrug efflux pump subunit AcrB
MSESEYADYEGLLTLARNAGSNLAKRFIPRLCEQLKRENPEMPNEDVRDTVTNDCTDVWSKATIRKFMPDEYKDLQKQANIKKRYEKRLEEPIPVGTVPTENSSVSQTGQESTSFEDTDRGPDVKPVAQTVNKLQNELKNVREVLESEIQNKDKRIREYWKVRT